MKSEELCDFTARPPSVGEWEELLVRLEIVPRVVRNALEEWEAGEPTAAVLRQALDREGEVGRLLETAAGHSPTAAPSPPASADAVELAHRFASLRARTFAMVQRRGLEVWDWEAEVGDGESATVHQLLSWLAARDGEMLAALREHAPSRRNHPVGEVDSATAVDG